MATGIGKDHRGHGAEVEGGVAAGHIHGSPAATCCRDINKPGLVGAVACGIDARRSGLLMVIHNNAAAPGFHTDRFQIQAVRIRGAPGGNQQLVRPQCASTGDHHKFVVEVVQVARLSLLDHLNALPAEHRFHSFSDRGIFPR